ncbi:hypothetical protein [Dysgonomonas sp. ZJ709]|uniref:hypothetical protein n=1 Tax=Dysgonomonas sp. ZJ709 TaxID=2709797 RepID=UPI0013EE20E8|nr:hypothetical protein [Dysgonomonas sp. ZJ709]
MALKVTDRQAARDWDAYYSNFVAEVNADENETLQEQKARIKRLESNFEEWKKYYFPKYCFAPPAPFHIKSSKIVLAKPELVLVRRWTREAAKDVVTMMETLYQTLTGVKKCIVLISNSKDKADDFLEPYKINLEKNERIINDYGVQQLPGSWSTGGFITTQGVAFYGFGAGQSPRGLRNEEVRPDKVIFTDMDTDEDVRNPDIIDKRWKWSEKAVYATRSISKDFQVIWLNNTIATDCCVVRASEKADYVEIVNIVDENGNSTWAEKNTPENIQRIRDTLSTAAFEAEYMNNPLTEGAVFKELVWDKVPSLSKFRFIVVYGDPSPSNSKNKKGSMKALFAIGFCEGKFYVLKGFLGHATNDEFVQWYYDLKNYVGDRTQVYSYVENNSLQDPFYEQVLIPLFAEHAKTKGFIGIITDTRSKPDKFSRIEGNLEPLNRMGNLVLNVAEKENPNMKRLSEQFLLVSPQLKAPADGPDDIEGGVWIINQKISETAADAMVAGKRHTNSKRQ